MKELISEGGAAGHMNHLYDNPDLTFRKMKQIFQSASNGKLKGTEKTDGQNLMLSYDISTSTARAARNKSDIKSGGLDAAGLASKFSDRGALEAAFTEAFAAFEEVIGRLAIEEREEIFGPDVNIYYNAEVQDPRAANLISYDLPTLTIHRVGHREVDRETGEDSGKDISKNAKKLSAALDRVQGERERGKFFVQMNVVRKLDAPGDSTAVNLAIARLDKALSDAEISDNQTVREYKASRIKKTIEQRIVLPESVEAELIKCILKEKGSTSAQVLKAIPENDAGTRAAIQELISKRNTILKHSIAPIEELVHDFAVEALKGLHSTFIADNDAEVERLRSVASKAIQAIKSSNSEQAMDILGQQLEKLKSIDRISTAAEGFVFDFDGVTYKFTGNFAPMNQLHGLLRYGRGNIPPLQKLEEEGSSQSTGGRRIVVIPGAFKPPHREHLDMVKYYAKMADHVIVLVSPLARKTPKGKAIGFEASKAVWEIYLRDSDLSEKVSVVRSPVNSPVIATFQYIENKLDLPEFAQPGDIILPGTSTKNEDEERFNVNFRKYAKKGVRVVNPFKYAFRPSEDPLSASDFRKALDTRSGLHAFVPTNTDPSEVLSVLRLESEQLAEVLTRLVEEVIDEMSSMAAGSVSGAIGGNEEDSLIREEEPEEEEIITEVFDYLVKKGVLT